MRNPKSKTTARRALNQAFVMTLSLRLMEGADDSCEGPGEVGARLTPSRSPASCAVSIKFC
jgi:hypothetical protein